MLDDSIEVFAEDFESRLMRSWKSLDPSCEGRQCYLLLSWTSCKVVGECESTLWVSDSMEMRWVRGTHSAVGNGKRGEGS